MNKYQKFKFKTRSDGGMQFDEKYREAYINYAKKNPDRNMVIEPEHIESTNQRRFFEGGLITLFAYLDGLDYKDYQVIKDLREYVIKPEFSPGTMLVRGKTVKIGKSTKGELDIIIERMIDWMEHEYGIDRDQCMDTKDFKKFRDTIWGFSNYDTYIDYLVDMKRLPEVYLRKI